MFDDVMTQRLDRLEREASRRKWDSAVMTASQRSHLQQVSASGQAGEAPGDQPLVDLLAERFDRLERKNDRLEWQIDRLERRARLWKRAVLCSVVTCMGLVVGLGVFALRPRPAKAQVRRPATVSLPSSLARAPQIGTDGERDDQAWVRP